MLEEGGYLEQFNDGISENNRMKALEDHNRRLSFWVAFGTVGLLVFEIVKFCFEHYYSC